MATDKEAASGASDDLDGANGDGAEGISVLVVDDDNGLRDILASWIQGADGFDCLGTCSDAESALSQFDALRPSVALVDINLPGMSGIECVRALKPRSPGTQFVMLTVYEDSDHIFDALSAGATGYLLKHTTREDLLASIAEVHQGGSPMTSNIARKVVQSLQRRQPDRDPAEELSKRENEVLSLLAQGYLYKEIADSLGVSFHSVNTYIRRIYEKLHVHSRSQAVALFARLPKSMS